MPKIPLLLSLSLLLPLIPFSQINAQSDLLPVLAEAPSQYQTTTTYTSTETPPESAPSLEMLDEMLFKYETVHFEAGDFRLDLTAKQILKRKANYIKKLYPGKQIVVTGHCDQRGSEEDNKYLGFLRANSVKQFLINCDIDRNRLRIDSAGATQPLAPDNNETAWAKNRRAEVKIR